MIERMFERPKKSDWHRLTDVDPVKRTAICSVCGPVRVRKRMGRKGGWRCRKQARLHVAQKAWFQRDKARWALQRRPYTAHKKTACERCGFVPEHACQLDVDHIDGDHENNDPANLRTLCANCHRLKTLADMSTAPRCGCARCTSMSPNH